MVCGSAQWHFSIVLSVFILSHPWLISAAADAEEAGLAAKGHHELGGGLPGGQRLPVGIGTERGRLLHGVGWLSTGPAEYGGAAA